MERKPLDKLDKIFQLQKDLASFISSDRYPRTKEERVSALCTAITHEAMELRGLQTGNGGRKSGVRRRPSAGGTD